MRRLRVGVSMVWWAGVCLSVVPGMACAVDDEQGPPPGSGGSSVQALMDEPAGVSDDPGSGEAESVSGGTVPEPVATGLPGTPTPPAPVSSRWVDTEVADPSGELDAVTIAVTNRTDEALEVEVALVSLGLDGKTVRVPVERGVMAARGEWTVRVPAERVGIKTRTTSSEMLVQLVVTRPDGSMRTYHGQPRYYHFDDGYRRLVLYGERVLLDRFSGGRLVDGVVRAEGRYWDGGVEREQAGGALRPLASLDGRASSGFYEQGPTTVVASSGADFDAGAGEAPKGGASPLANVVYFCTTWRASFTDVGYGEDYWTSSSPQDGTAAWARYRVYDSSAVLISSGYLDAAGCTAALSVPAGTYYLLQETAARRGDINYDVWKAALIPGRPDNGSLENYTRTGYALSTVVTVSGSSSGAIWVHPSTLTNYTRLMTELGYFLNRPDNGFPSGNHTVMYDINCPGYSDPVSCYVASSNSVWMAESACDEKFIFTHEIGHQVQIVSTGLFAFDYSASVSEPSCRCDHVNPPQFRAHCLQSREYTYTAILEGFGYFYAAKPWNYAGGSDCWMAHPKAFRTDGGLIIGPPYAADCRGYVRWMENHCLASSRGVEWDWMNFFWNWHTVTADKVTMAEIYDVIRGACGGWCDPGDQIGWNSMVGAAFSKWGWGSAKYNYFLSTGDNTGVDH